MKKKKKLSLRQVSDLFCYGLLIWTIAMLFGLFFYTYVDYRWLGGTMIVGGTIFLLGITFWTSRKLRCPRCGKPLQTKNNLTMELLPYCAYCGEKIDLDAKYEE